MRCSNNPRGLSLTPGPPAPHRRRAESPSSPVTALHELVSLLCNLLESHELESCFAGVFSGLARRHLSAYVVPPPPTASAAACALPASTPSGQLLSAGPVLELVAALCEVPSLMHLWAALPCFHDNMEAFLARKALNTNDLAALLPAVWWHGATDEACSEGERERQTEGGK